MMNYVRAGLNRAKEAAVATVQAVYGAGKMAVNGVKSHPFMAGSTVAAAGAGMLATGVGLSEVAVATVPYLLNAGAIIVPSAFAIEFVNSVRNAYNQGDEMPEGRAKGFLYGLMDKMDRDFAPEADARLYTESEEYDEVSADEQVDQSNGYLAKARALVFGGPTQMAASAAFDGDEEVADLRNDQQQGEDFGYRTTRSKRRF